MRFALQERELRLPLHNKVGVVVKTLEFHETAFVPNLFAMAKAVSGQYFRSMNISSMTMEVLK